MMMNNKIQTVLDEFFPNPKCPLNYTKDYELLIAVMLSAQTTDERVNSVTKKLFKYNLNELAELPLNEIEQIIKPVGTQKRKSEYIKNIAINLLKDHGGRVPHDRKYLENLSGVGHKTCNVVFSELFSEPCFAVDTHVSRVSKRLGIANEGDRVIEIEEKLCDTFPYESWSRMHVQFVLFGRHICKAINPLCDTCPFKNNECKKNFKTKS